MNQQMGEVGANSVDDPHVNAKMNGGINGNCEDEPMDVVDAQNSSQNSSESVKKIVDDESVSVSDDKILETNDNIQNEDKLNKKECDDSNSNDLNSKHTMEIDIENDLLSQENGSSEAKRTCDDSNEEIDLNKSSESDLIVTESTDIEHGGIETNVSETSEEHSAVTHKKTIENDVTNINETKNSISTENGTNIASDMLDDSDDLLRPISQSEDDVVHAISDSDDDGDNDIHEVESNNPKPMDTSDDVTELDNNSQSKNGVNKIVLEDDDNDDDKPVSIHSDSDSEHEANEDEVHEILSDKEDCVVVEDDKRLDGSDLSIRSVNRARKSAVRPRDFSTFDDDIEEIIEDPLEQSASKKPRLNDPLTMNDESQNQSNKSNEPTLVIIDTNTILSRGSTPNAQAGQTNVQSLNDATQSYPIDSRTSITPVPNNNQTIANVTSTTLAGLNAPVLTALTDDMFVLEAPSFIVPYIYEKPPSIELKDIVTKMGIEIEERKALEELEKKKKEAEKEKEKEMNKEKDKDSNDDEDCDDAKETDKSDDEQEKKTKKRKSNKNGDESWDESDLSTDDDVSDIEETKVLIKEAKTDLDTIQTHIISRDITKDLTSDDKKDTNNYFDSPLGKFFMDIGINLVQEHVQTDLLRQQKRKLNREGNQASPDVQQAINSLMKNLELSKGKNDPFKFETKRCEYCYFKSESSLVMAHHYETPHMKGNLYKCNFCAFEIKPPYEILLHMQNVHNIKARLEKALSYHQCPNCLFEDNGKSKLARHAVVCSKKFRPEVNLAPPVDWDPPAKIPRIKPRHGLVGTANAYQAMAAQAQRAATAAAIQRQNAANAAAIKNRGRPQTVSKMMPTTNNNMRPQQQAIRPQVAGGIVLPNNFQVTNPGQFIQATSSKSQKNSQQPSISITALPRQTQPNPPTNLSPSNALQQSSILSKPPGAANVKPGQTQSGGKASFVICEICDGWIKDLDQLRNHMQWMHKVKIHPKMIYNRPPLNCQKCQFRFFTDQGLERHLLGSHGLVTSSMQEAANKGKDAGRCPVCGRMYQWKLLNHVSREHNMTLKPAHLSYKCTVCTATFGMYKQFENHVYSAHSTVAKRSNEGTVAKKSNDGKSKLSSSSSSSSSINVGSSSRSNLSGVVPGAGTSMLKQPFKINDEITITPQPATRTNRPIEIESHVID